MYSFLVVYQPDARADAHHGAAGSPAGKVHGRLADRVSPAHDENIVVAAQGGLARAGSIIDSRAQQFRFAGQVEALIFDAGGSESGASHNLRPIRQITDANAIVEFRTHSLARQQNLGPEPAGPSAQHRAFNHHGLEAFGSGIDRRTQAGGAGANPAGSRRRLSPAPLRRSRAVSIRTGRRCGAESREPGLP